MARSLGAGDTLTSALAGGPSLATVFPSNNSLADQLRMVARMIRTAPELGVADRVTTFTTSDFGRTFTGTDGSGDCARSTGQSGGPAFQWGVVAKSLLKM